MALVMSFVIKRDSEVIDYEDAFGKMSTVDDFSLRGMIFTDVYLDRGSYRLIFAE